MNKYRTLSKLLTRISINDWLYSTVTDPRKSKMAYIYFKILLGCYECGFFSIDLYNSYTHVDGALKDLQRMHLITLRGSLHGMTMISNFGPRTVEYYNCYMLTKLGREYVQKTHFNRLFNRIYRSSKRDSITNTSELRSGHLMHLSPFERFCLRVLLGTSLLSIMAVLIMIFGIISGVIDDSILISLIYWFHRYIMYFLYHKPLSSDACHRMMDANGELSESNILMDTYITWDPKQDDRKLFIELLMDSKFFKKYQNLYPYISNVVDHSMFG